MPYVLIRGNLASYSHKYPWRVLVSGLKGQWFCPERHHSIQTSSFSTSSSISLYLPWFSSVAMILLLLQLIRKTKVQPRLLRLNSIQFLPSFTFTPAVSVSLHSYIGWPCSKWIIYEFHTPHGPQYVFSPHRQVIIRFLLLRTYNSLDTYITHNHSNCPC